MPESPVNDDVILSNKTRRFVFRQLAIRIRNPVLWHLSDSRKERRRHDAGRKHQHCQQINADKMLPEIQVSLIKQNRSRAVTRFQEMGVSAEAQRRPFASLATGQKRARRSFSKAPVTRSE
jgi:hypothetical protein